MEKHQLRQDVGRLGGGISTERWHVVVQMQFLAFVFLGTTVQCISIIGVHRTFVHQTVMKCYTSLSLLGKKSS